MSDLDFTNYEPEPQKPRRGNKAFMAIAGILAAIILVAIVAAAAYAVLVLPKQNAARAEQAIQINAQNTATVMAVTQAAMTEMAPTETTMPTDTPEATSTPEPTATPEPEVEAEAKAADVIAIGDVLRPGPCLVREAQRENVTVRTNSGITEQVPGAADARPPLQDGVGDLRVLLAQSVCGADAGDTGTDDQHIEELAVATRHESPLIKSGTAGSTLGHRDPRPSSCVPTRRAAPADAD